MSSLSHSSVVRPSMAARVTTASSVSGPFVMTKPPTWVERCRGKPTSSPASCSAQARRRSASGSSPCSRAISAKLACSNPQAPFASRAVMSSLSPIALPASRIAPRARKRLSVAAMAARSRP
ncbi:hypothetical protein ROTAS13_04579 [Roseomonas sp. TAS13]|nr:hypothetical protein ROTAS13_04579 [Roseomonas sp. TAS13]